MRTGVRKVQQQNVLALVLDEMDTIIHCGARGSSVVVPLWSSVLPVVRFSSPQRAQRPTGRHRETYPNTDSTTLYTSSIPEPSAAAPLPPASPRSAPPPPSPPPSSPTPPTP